MKKWIMTAGLAACILGVSTGVILAQASNNNHICGGDGSAADPTRTNNSNCAGCISGCKFGDDRFKVCQVKVGSNCVHKKIPDVKKCDGELWTNQDCTGNMSGTCQNNYPYCT